MTNPNGIRYCVDGHEFDNEQSHLAGDGQFAPFYIFDIEAQMNLPEKYPTREMAESALSAMLDQRT